MKYLQKNRFGKKEGSMALTAQQVQKILADEFLNSNTYEGGSAQDIYLPLDLEVITNINKYLSK
ncbi:hypothetical protein RhiirA5_426333 [Rhizophagus irregularis]|uniref:Uncharacterized protein n=1 Tax=Rhizophagus irregularis TaxID=588596 RepID=A0A2I1F962_9GLOM|nr:hypothetical protein RhiirA5_426333 [Rhizophagus irregularis]PKC57440.1 hypothetical protein RhiirA1_472496 [Rhizophagus irregularis]PKY30898.1 hypothetical protein RhiirB3_448214 [Rhizophagus irregularis]